MLIGISDEDEREYRAKRGFLHELNHQYGAPDHYHEVITEDDGDKVCKNKAICSYCGAEPRDGECVMGPQEESNGELLIICADCMNDILAHLEDHHE